MVIEAYDFSWLVHSTKAAEPGSFIGMSLNPEDIHIMHKSDAQGFSFAAPDNEVVEDENKL